MNKIALAYASALLSLAQANDNQQVFMDQLNALITCFSEETIKAFDSVEFGKEAQKQVIKEVCQDFHPYIINFLCVLVDNQRMHYLPSIVQAYQTLLDQALGIVRGECISAHDLGQEQMNQLSQALSQQLNKTVVLTNNIDRSLIAGFKVIINGKIYDYTLNSQLNEMRQQLKKGVSR